MGGRLAVYGYGSLLVDSGYGFACPMTDGIVKCNNFQ